MWHKSCECLVLNPMRAVATDQNWQLHDESLLHVSANTPLTMAQGWHTTIHVCDSPRKVSPQWTERGTVEAQQAM